MVFSVHNTSVSSRPRPPAKPNSLSRLVASSQLKGQEAEILGDFLPMAAQNGDIIPGTVGHKLLHPADGAFAHAQLGDHDRLDGFERTEEAL